MSEPQPAGASSAESKSWPNWLAGLALVAGLGVGLLALMSAMGIWLGWWDFRRSFDLLRIANTSASWIAGAALLITIALLIAGRGRAGSSLRLPSMALIGTILAALAYYVPESYRPPEGVKIPPIHDISTDTLNPPEFVAVLPLRADAPNSAVYGDSPDMDPAKLAQLQTEAYPDLKPLAVSEPPDVVFERALAAVKQLNWELVASSPGEGRIEATDTTFWFRFKDDVVIRITPTAAGCVVDARSVSRVGRGDVGTNAKRLRALLALL